MTEKTIVTTKNKEEKIKENAESFSKNEEIKKAKVSNKKLEKQNEPEKKESVKNEKSLDATEKKQEEKKEIKEKPKKTEAIARAYDLPISTKHSIATCRFIKNKKIEDAIEDLESVLKFKKSIPMKGEIPHRKGKKMMSGRFATKTVEKFKKLLQSLSSNANSNGLENPVIVEAIANIGQRPFGRFGEVRKKRTHIKITAKNMERKNG